MQTAAPMSSPCTMGYRAACRPPTTRPGGGRHSRSSRRSSRRARRRLNLARLSRFAAALLLGMVSGALFLGVGGRLAMHGFALASAQSAGFTLLGGLILSGATLYLARRLSQPPPVGEARVLTLVLAVVSVGVLVIAVGMLRPRVPERRSEQNPEAYWTDASRAAAIVLWTAIEGAGLVGAVGYFLTAAAA